MPFNTSGRNAMISGLAGVINHIAVHAAIPDASGSDEIAGGSYARQPVAWTAPTGAEASNNADLVHDMPAGSTAVAYGYWDALAIGSHYGHTLIGSTQAGFGCVDADGVASNAIQSAAHGLSDTNRVAVYSVHAEGLPTGLAERTLYHVIGATVDTFQVALVQGGVPVDITGQGELWWQDCVPEMFGADGELVTAAGDLSLNANVI